MSGNGKDETSIDIDPMDAAIVFHADEAPSLYMPEMGDDEFVPDHVMTALAVLNALEDDELREAIRAKFEAVMDQVEADAADDQA